MPSPKRMAGIRDQLKAGLGSMRLIRVSPKKTPVLRKSQSQRLQPSSESDVAADIALTWKESFWGTGIFPRRHRRNRKGRGEKQTGRARRHAQGGLSDPPGTIPHGSVAGRVSCVIAAA